MSDNKDAINDILKELDRQKELANDPPESVPVQNEPAYSAPSEPSQPDSEPEQQEFSAPADEPENEENELKIEDLEKLSFYLSFYYWTWAGAIRMPSLLKMSTTAMQFYSKIFNNQPSYIFSNPTYI